MNADELLSQSLCSLAEPVAPARSIASRVLERIAEPSIAPPQTRALRYSLTSRRRPRFRWPARAGLTASLLGMAAAGWFLFAGGAPTIADVEAALAKERWVHLAYDDRSEEWICLDDGRRFHKSHDGDLYFRDPATRTEQRYISDIGQINISKPTAWVEGVQRNGRLIPVEAAELDFSDLDARKPQPVDQETLRRVGVAMEFDVVTKDGRKLGCFRQSRRDSLGKMQIDKELWIDMATRLPFRIRTRLNARDQQAIGREYRTATYHFGPTGPGDLYDIGAPRTATIFRYRPRHEQIPLLTEEAQQALRGAAAAIRSFPPQFRVIELGDKVQISYWSATKSQMEGIADSILGVGSKQGSPRFFCADNQQPSAWPQSINELADDDSPEAQVPAEEIARWFPIPQAYITTMYNGSRQYYMTSFGKSVELHVIGGAIFREPPPLADSWSFADWNHSEFAPPDESDAPAPKGQLLVISRRTDLKNNWWVDPARDFTVTRRVERRLIAGKWTMTNDAHAVGWRQTPGGSWYVSAWDVHEPDLAPAEGTEPMIMISRRRVEITPLTDKDLPGELFDGEKLLERARKANAKIQVD